MWCSAMDGAGVLFPSVLFLDGYMNDSEPQKCMHPRNRRELFDLV